MKQRPATSAPIGYAFAFARWLTLDHDTTKFLAIDCRCDWRTPSTRALWVSMNGLSAVSQPKEQNHAR